MPHLQPWLVVIILSVVHFAMQVGFTVAGQIPLLAQLQEEYDGSSDRTRQFNGILYVRRVSQICRMAGFVLSIIYLWVKTPLVESLFFMPATVLICSMLGEFSINARIRRISDRRARKSVYMSIVLELLFGLVYLGVFHLVFPAGTAPLREWLSQFLPWLR